MNDYPLQRILDFVRHVVPFDTLSEDALMSLVAEMEIAYFPTGSEVFAQGSEPPEYLHIIQSGSAKLSLLQDQGEMLVDVRAEGDVLGDTSILQGNKALFSCQAREDLICYLLPAQVFKDLVATNPNFERHFRHSLARNLQAVQASCHEVPSASGGADAASLDAALMGSRVSDLMRPKVLTCLPSTPVRAAARMMTRDRVGAIVVMEYDNTPLGIVTDSDLRARVVAEGADTSRQAADFMSRPLHTISPDTFVFEALVTMSHFGVHHLVVADGGRVVGMVSDQDLQSVTGGSPVTVAREIDKCVSLQELVEHRSKIDRVLEMMLSQGGSAPELLDLVTEYNDRLTRRLIELVQAELLEEGFGGPPVPFVWLAFGSEGRKEQTLSTDQDNGLIYANQPVSRERGVKRWFLHFSERVVDGLELCGFPLCKGNVMASNPAWCQSQDAWQSIFHKWVADPEPKSLRLASIFFDFRGIYVQADFVRTLFEALRQAVEGNRLFLRYMTKNALYNKPPLGFLRQFVVHKDGKHKNKLNLKLSGLTPMVDALRVVALELGLTATNTLDRLDAASDAGIINRQFAADLHEAFSYITLLRISKHLDDRARGELPDNFVDPDQLNSLQRKMLKESFGVISKLQELMEHRYQTRSVA